MYFWYISSSSLAMCSAIIPSIMMCMHSFISAYRKAPGIFITATYRPSFSSIQHDIIMASSDTVGEPVSSFSVYCCCGLMSVHPLTFTAPSIFLLINIKYLRAFAYPLDSGLLFILPPLPFCHAVVIILLTLRQFAFA